MNHRLAFIARLSSLTTVVALLSSAIGAAFDVEPAYADKGGVCGTPGQQGTSNVTGIVNSYYPGTATATANSTTITVGTARAGGGSAIAAGNLLLVIQMQGEDMNSTNTNNYGNGSGNGGTTVNTVTYPTGEPDYAGGNLATNFQAGQHEYVRAVSLVGTTLTIATGLVNTYVSSDPATSADQGRRRFQVIRVPQYVNATLTGTVTAPRWDGGTGGIVALDVASQLNWNGNTIDVTGLGFRGGGARQLMGTTGFNWWDFRTIAGAGNNVAGANGAKGEGTAGTPRYVNDNGTLLDAGAGAEGYPNGSNGRGAGGDGGGGSTDGNPSANDQNSGGGGGGNGGYGGMGGWSWNSAIISGGYGGSLFNPSATGPTQALRLSLGGGGGAGTTNNGTGLPLGFSSSGVAGGGMVLVRSGTITGTGTINANGLSAPARGDANVVLNDGGGGGGAGGTVLVIANNGSGSVGALTVNANGGRGGDNWPNQAPGTARGVTGAANNRHGPGGGGGGGHVFVSGAITSSVLGGANGITTTDNDPFGATPGGPGEVVTVTPTDTPTIVAGADCVDLSITKTDGVATVNTGATTTYTIVVTNPGPSSADGAIFKDPGVVGLNVTSVTCGSPTGGAVCPTGAGLSIALMQGAGIVIPTLPGGASPGSSVTFTVVAQVTATGASVTNTATVDVPSGMTDTNPANNTASDTDTVIAVDLHLAKTDGVTQVVAGGTTPYTLTVSNTGTAATSGTITVVDVLPTGMSMADGAVSLSGTNAADWSCSSVSNVITCTSTVSIAATSGTSVFSFTVNVDLTAAGTLTNKGQVGGGGDPTETTPTLGTAGACTGTDAPTQGCATDTDSVIAPGLHLAKTDGVTQVVAGGTTPYTLTVSNTGTAATSGTITVVDVLPTGMSVADGAVSLSGTNAADWSCSSVSNVITCTSTVSIVATSGTSVVSFTVNVDLTAAGTLTNKGQVGGGGDPTETTPTPTTAGACTGTDAPTQGCATDTDTVIAPGLHLAKTDGVTQVVAGGTTPYTLTVSNTGTAATSGTITVVDVLPTGMSVADGAVSLSGTNAADWSCSSVSNVITCTSTVSIAATSGTSVVSFTVNVDPTAAGTLTNKGQVGGGGDPTETTPTLGTAGACTGTDAPTQGCATDTDSVITPSLHLAKTDSLTQVVAGGTTTYVLTVSNTGGAATSGTITVVDVLPTGMSIGAGAVTLGGAQAANWSCSASGQVIACTSSTSIAAAGTSVFSFTVNVALSAVGPLTNKGQVGGGGDPNTSTPDATTAAACTGTDTPTQGCATDSDSVIAPSLHLAKTDGMTQVTAGGTTTYILTVTNSGGADTSGAITLVDVLPTGLSIPSGSVSLGGAQAANWSCTASGQVITCTSSTTIAASGGTSLFSFTVNVGLTATGILTNKGQVGGGGDPTETTPTSGTAGACTGTDVPTQGCAIDSDTVYTPGITKCILPFTQRDAAAPDPTQGPDGTDCPTQPLVPNVRIGDIVWYRVDIQLGPGTYGAPSSATAQDAPYGAEVVDTLSTGLSFLACESIGVTSGTIATDLSEGFGDGCPGLAASGSPPPLYISPAGPPAPTFNTPANPVDVQRIVTFHLGTLTVGSGGGTLTLIYSAVVLDSQNNLAGASLNNSVQFLSNVQNLGTPQTTVHIVEPQLAVTKTVDTTNIALGTDVTYTITVQHASGNTENAYDVVMHDVLPIEVDYDDSLTATGGAACSFTAPSLPDEPSGSVNCSWPNPFTPATVSVIQFKAKGNANLVAGVQFTNVAFVQWTSLPGFADPNRWNPNLFSTERFFDPTDPTVNDYGASSNTPVGPLGGGGGGGCKNCFRIPQAGFAPGVFTDLSGIPQVAYKDTMGVSLRIPKMNVNMNIVGVPLVNGVWQVDWLTGVGGWLQGTAFPGLSGNSVIMGHVVTHYGSNGPFANLTRLQAGDLIFVTAFGRVYVYKVRSAGDVAPNDITVLNHADHPVLTLITCSKYNLLTQSYDGRWVVRADLVQVDPLR